MYVRRSQLAGAAAAPATVSVPVPVDTPGASLVQGSSAALAARAARGQPLAYMVRQVRPVGTSWGARVSTPQPTQSQITEQRAAAARAALPPPPPPKARFTAFYDESRRTLVEQARPSGIDTRDTPDLYDAEDSAPVHDNEFTPTESVSHGDRAQTTAVNLTEKSEAPAAVPLIPLAIAAWLLLGA